MHVLVHLAWIMSDLESCLAALNCDDGTNIQITKQIYNELIEAKADLKLGQTLNILYLEGAKTCYIECRECNKPVDIYIPIYFDAKIDLHKINRLRDELNYSEEYNLVLAICDSNLTILYYEFNNFDIKGL